MTAAVVFRKAMAAGRSAAQAREPVTACPYRGDADTARERSLARAWIRGYGAGNPMPADPR
jgi:hypothetical protein